MQSRNEGKSNAALTLFLLFAIPVSARAATLGFQPAASYPVGQAPFEVTADDFNADGIPDLAVVNAADGTVSILLGKGDGTFTPAMHFNACPAVPQNCTRLAAGDFDADNKADLAVLRPGDRNTGDNGDMTIFLSNGNGTFHKGQVLNPGKNPSSVIVHDVDADHKPDLIVSNTTDNSVAILLGKGDGTFQAPVPHAVGTGPTSMLLVDFNQDGLLDIAVRGSIGGSSTDILLANGDGTFRKGPSFLIGVFFPIVAWADFDQDGKIDYLTSGCDLGGKCNVAVALGNGDGTFRTPRSTPSADMFTIFVADYDGDGKLDIAGAPHPIKGQIAVLLGNGDGTFQPAVSFTIDPNLDVGLGMVADLNQDQAPDLVTINGNSTISVLLNNGTDFSISASQLSALTLSPGQSSTSTLTITVLNNFDNPVALACSVQPAGPGAPSCSLSATSVTPQPNGSATSTLTISTGSALTSASTSFAWLLAPVLGLAGIGASSARRKRRLRRGLARVVLSAGLLLEIACGGGDAGHRMQSYTVTVTGSSTFNQHSTSLTLRV